MTWTNSIASIFWIALIGVLLFVPAGTLDWPAGWVVHGGVRHRRRGHHDLAGAPRSRPAERAHGRCVPEGPGTADRVFMAFIIVVWYGWLVLMGLDAERWRLSHMPSALSVVGGVLIALGYVIVWRVFRANSFAAPVIRIQEERGQHVIDTGPYAVVRHPMYAGGMIFMLGMPLLLGSWFGLLVLPLMLAALRCESSSRKPPCAKALPVMANMRPACAIASSPAYGE